VVGEDAVGQSLLQHLIDQGARNDGEKVSDRHQVSVPLRLAVGVNLFLCHLS
jgi:hypothetical protein